MKILSVDTSCDETSAAVCENDRLLSNVVSSQIDLHSKWKGVVPIIAKRAHQERIDDVINEALKRSGCKFHEIDFYAVTIGPGLAIALEVGIKKILELSKKYDKPIIPVNHMEGHIYSNFIKNRNGKYYNNLKKIKFPIVCLLISGGHTEIVLMNDHGEYQLLGETLDDAVGEAFDKVARPLNLGYPGGPIIEDFARKGSPKFNLPLPMKRRKDFNFSYSGLKTACIIKIEELKKEYGNNFYSIVPDFCASFQKTITESLLFKIKKVLEKYEIKQILIGGGVIRNDYIRKMFRKELKNRAIDLVLPHKKFCTDNAAMIGVCAYYKVKRGEYFRNPNKIDRIPNLKIDEKISLD
ncbi:MAG: tRNA (adenosine(37)-N6)-threonylcarbamoyltransferase complex transferase subunit TsaD [Candidatus Aenigmatarchaeota archaeon]